MSRSRIAAVVCEGQTDAPILRTIIMNRWPEIDEVRVLQPELDETERAKGPAGWTRVRHWCQERAGALNEVLDPDVGDPIDLLLIAIDVDIAVDAGIADPPQSVGVYETSRLRETIATWLTTSVDSKLPKAVIISTPALAIEAWIVAALFPKERRPEAIADPAKYLVTKKKLRLSPKDGKPWKELHRYRDFADALSKKIKHVRKVCTEAERTMSKIEHLAK